MSLNLNTISIEVIDYIAKCFPLPKRDHLNMHERDIFNARIDI